MEEIRIKISDELKFLKRISDTDWTILATGAIKEKLKEIERLRKGISKSKITGKDVEELTDEINTDLAKKYLK